MGMCMSFLWHEQNYGSKLHIPCLSFYHSILLLCSLSCLISFHSPPNILLIHAVLSIQLSSLKCLYFCLSWTGPSIPFLQKWCHRESRLLVWDVVRGFSQTASVLLLFFSWTWCIALFTRPAWLINSPLRGLFILCFCLFYNVYAIFRVSHFHKTGISIKQSIIFVFVEEFS